MVLFAGVLLRVKINLYGEKSNPFGRDEKMLVSPGDFQVLTKEILFHPFLKGVSDSGPQIKCFQIFIESRFYS